MRKLILLVLLLCSTTAYAEMSDAQKLAQYGKLRLSYGNGGGIPDSTPALTVRKALQGVAVSREDG